MTAVANSWYMIPAYDGDRLVGIGRIVSDVVLHSIVYDLITDPKYQGQGTGSEILKRIFNKCQETNIPDVQLFSARGKRRFYEERGFRGREAESPGMEYVPTR